MKKKTIFIYALCGLLAACSETANQNDSSKTSKESDKKERAYDGATEATEKGDYEITSEPNEYVKTIEMDDQSVALSMNTESYAYIEENSYKNPLNDALSTFSVDVDNASYTNTRRMLENGNQPPIDAVRIEEFINYFNYDYPNAKDDPFSVTTELGVCPWNEDHQILHIGLQGKKYDISELPPSNLVFLLDVSGSMNEHSKLPLLKKSMIKMVSQLSSKDKVSIVVYAGSSGVVLEPTSCDQKFDIMRALSNLEAGGSTGGAEGLERAYALAEENFNSEGNNRIILATDGDFNVGPSSDAEMQRMIESHRDKGISITLLGFGMGNYKDSKMEAIADHGNGNYFYIDDMRATDHALVDNLAGTLVTIAKDVKIQIEFNPLLVKSYRLIGYENRVLNDEDFQNDKKDAGEIGAGHSVTALYEIVPGKASGAAQLKFQTSEHKSSADLAFLKLRYKQPNGITSKLIERTISNKQTAENDLSRDFKFSSYVAAFGLKLRQSKYLEKMTYQDLLKRLDDCEFDKRQMLELYEMIKLASNLTPLEG